MSQEWMLERISDLRRVAEKSGFTELGEQLDDTLIVAAREMRLAEAGRQTAGGCNGMGIELSGIAGAHDQP